MGNRQGIIYAALQRLDQLMAIGEKRAEAKQAARSDGTATWTFSSGKIHSYQTRTAYQQHVLRFINWTRREHGVNRLEVLDAHAEDLASRYLSERVAQGYSAWTLQAERSAFRLFFSHRRLAEEVAFPRRRRQDIVRSRQPVVRDQHLQPEHWQSLIDFLLACGLRREELRDLLVGDVYPDGTGQLLVHVRKGKGGRERKVVVFPGREPQILRVVVNRSPEEHVFPRLPGALDIHALRRQFAQELYQHYSGRPLPAPEGRLAPATIDRAAAEKVTRTLGHNRLEVLYEHYLR